MIGRVVLVLVAVALFLAIIGKLRLPQVPQRPKDKAVESARKCPGCGAYVLADQPCTSPGCRSHET